MIGCQGYRYPGGLTPCRHIGYFKTMSLQAKKSFAAVDYEKCDPKACSPEKGDCASAVACTRKVIKQIDGRFEQPVIFQDMCMACWDCIEACPLNSVRAVHMV